MYRLCAKFWALQTALAVSYFEQSERSVAHRRKSESLEPLIDFLASVVSKLYSKTVLVNRVYCTPQGVPEFSKGVPP